jgi:hypothetical protein
MSAKQPTQPRQPKGVPTGGQWRATARPEGNDLGGAGEPAVRCAVCGKGPEAGRIQIYVPESGPQYHDRCLAAKMAGNEADMASRLVASGAVPCYARFGAPPRTGRSTNYAEGTTEAGISVFRAWLSSDGTAAWYVASDSYSAVLFGTSRPAWVVEGATVVGTGSDLNPLTHLMVSH